MSVEATMPLTETSAEETSVATPVAVPGVDPDLFAAHLTYVEQWGSLLTMNTTLKAVVLCLAIVDVGALWLVWRAMDAVKHDRPLIVRVNEVGRAEAVNVAARPFEPQAPELKYFLSQFVIKHFSRMRAMVHREYGESLYFLAPDLRKRAMELELGPTGGVAQFLQSQSPELDIEIKNVALRETRTPPYMATVDFERVYYQMHTRQEIKREGWTATFNFTVLPEVPLNLVPYNPLGLVITYYRTDGDFQ